MYEVLAIVKNSVGDTIGYDIVDLNTEIQAVKEFDTTGYFVLDTKHIFGEPS